MKKRLITFLVDAVVTVSLLSVVILTIGLLNGAALHYGDDPRVLDWDREGPYVFFGDGDLLTVDYVRGSMTDGYHIERSTYSADSAPTIIAFNPLDGTSFDLTVDSTITPPSTTSRDVGKILAVSDIEGNYQALRGLLIENGLVDRNLGWSFGTGHLVLLGDFVDRGLRIFNVRKVVVGHTIQSEVYARFNGKVIGIDVEHPADDHENWPRRRSEALLIDGARYFRVLDSGEKIELASTSLER